MFSSRFMLFPTLKKKKKIGVKKNSGGGGGGGELNFFFRKTILSHLTFYAIFNIKKKKYWKVPLHLLVKWEVVSPNSRWGQLESISKKIKFREFFFSKFHVFFTFHAIWGGGGVEFFFLEKQFFLISRFMLFSTLKINNIEKCPFTYWLNGRWFLQIVDGDSWNIYPLYILYSFVLILYLKCGGGLGGGV